MYKIINKFEIKNSLIILDKLSKDKKKLADKSYLKKITNEITLKKLKTNKLYDANITTYASSIAKIKFIRNLLKQFQKKWTVVQTVFQR